MDIEFGMSMAILNLAELLSITLIRPPDVKGKTIH
jgi:hypothetical protein